MLGGDHFDSLSTGLAPSGNWLLGPLILVEDVLREEIPLDPRFHPLIHRAQRLHSVRNFLFTHSSPCRTACVTQLALFPVQHTEPTYIFEVSRCFTETNDPFFIRTTVERTFKDEIIGALQII